jgi:hypothetical protein
MDNWQHRSKEMCCETCMYFILKAPTDNFGRCRRHAPTMSGFPAVFDSDWCGDHKLDKNKLSSGLKTVDWGSTKLGSGNMAMSSDDPKDWQATI